MTDVRLEKQVKENTERSLSNMQFIEKTLPLMFSRIEECVERVEALSKKSLNILENGLVVSLKKTIERLDEHIDCYESEKEKDNENEEKERRKGVFSRMPVYKKVITIGAIIGVMFRPEIKELAVILIKWYFGIEI